ncbi:MAG TPA: hypothetical protein VKG92_00460, partial [Flavobacteriales bacterium]|nr:hypothetical protein [Flavobacteriales bacterium]
MNKFLAPMGRLAFVMWTVILLLAAFLMLRVILTSITGHHGSWPDGWHFLDPLALVFSPGVAQRYALSVHAGLTLALAVIGIKRARHAGWPSWIGIIMAVPIVRLFAF